MTDRQRNALGISLSVLLTLVVLSCRSCSGGEVARTRRVTRITVTRPVVKPVRVQARADAGWPVRQTVKYAAGIGYYGARALATISFFL
jgi:hypothetical protein